MLRSKKGFTLIEMLVVIAIIAVLVAIIIPVVGNANLKSKAAADAANLRGLQGQMNSQLVAGIVVDVVNDVVPVESRLYPGAQMRVLYTDGSFMYVYFVQDGRYYGLEYFSDVALNGKDSSVSVQKPALSGTWYIPGKGVAPD